jgi:hypothetical protein
VSSAVANDERALRGPFATCRATETVPAGLAPGAVETTRPAERRVESGEVASYHKRPTSETGSVRVSGPPDSRPPAGTASADGRGLEPHPAVKPAFRCRPVIAPRDFTLREFDGAVSSQGRQRISFDMPDRSRLGRGPSRRAAARGDRPASRRRRGGPAPRGSASAGRRRSACRARCSWRPPSPAASASGA